MKLLNIYVFVRNTHGRLSSNYYGAFDCVLLNRGDAEIAFFDLGEKPIQGFTPELCLTIKSLSLKNPGVSPVCSVESSEQRRM